MTARLLLSCLTALGLAGAVTASFNKAGLRLHGRDYMSTVCSPPPQATGGLVAPCIEITTIETVCEPNGTAPLDYAAHAECICGGSFFAEWDACLVCLYLHGERDARDVAFYDGVASAASTSLCGFLTNPEDATPTAEWASIFSAVEVTAVYPTTGSTVSSNVLGSQTAISYYYTPSGPQGPGAITGSAAMATATPSVSGTGSPSGTASGSESVGSEQTTGGSGSGSESTSGAGTSATGKPSSAASVRPAQAVLMVMAVLALAAAM